jgi:hypothetical protein
MRRLRWKIAAVLFACGLWLQVPAPAQDGKKKLEIHEWSVWIADPNVENANARERYQSAMPTAVTTIRSREVPRGEDRLAPVSVITFYGDAIPDQEVTLQPSSGQFVAHWPAAELKNRRLRWPRLALSPMQDDKASPAFVPEDHWFQQARKLDSLYVTSGARSERFLTYDLELKFPIPFKIEGGPDRFRITNLGKTPLHDIILVSPSSEGRRVAWLDLLRAAPVSAAPAKTDTPKTEEPKSKPDPVSAADAKEPEQDAAPAGALAESEVLRFRADERRIVTNDAREVTILPNRGHAPENATPVADVAPPKIATATINGHGRSVLRFSGKELLQVPGSVPSVGSLFVVFRPDPAGGAGQRLVGWEDSSVGQHGVGLMTDGAGAVHAILRRNGANGDVVVPAPTPAPTMSEFQVVCISWGPSGVTVHRSGQAAGANKGIDSVSSDPAITALRIGGPGSGSYSRFQGDLAELRVYATQVDDEARANIEADLTKRWCTPPSEQLKTIYPVGEFFLSAPLKTDTPEFESATRKALAERLARAGLTAQESHLILSQYSKAFFESRELVVLFRLPPDAIDESVPLEIYPEPQKIVRVALALIRNIDPRSKDEVKALIARLGDKKYSDREAAEKRLIELGVIAVTALKEALKDKDPEVVFRAERILLGRGEKIE